MWVIIIRSIFGHFGSNVVFGLFDPVVISRSDNIYQARQSGYGDQEIERISINIRQPYLIKLVEELSAEQAYVV